MAITDDILKNATEDFAKTAKSIKRQFDNFSCEVVITRREALDVINMYQALLLKEAELRNGKL